MAWQNMSPVGIGSMGSGAFANALRRQALLQGKKTDLLDRNGLSAVEQGLPTMKGWYNTKTGALATGFNVASDPLNRYQEQPIYPNELAREKLQTQWSNAPMQYATNPDGTVTATRSMNAGYNADGITRGQALTYKYILPKQSIGAGFRQQMNPETDAQRAGMYDRGGSYSNMMTSVSPYKMGASSFALPTARSGGLLTNGVTDYTSGRAIGGIGGLAPLQYQRFRGNSQPTFDNWNFPELSSASSARTKPKANNTRRYGLSNIQNRITGRNY